MSHVATARQPAAALTQIQSRCKLPSPSRSFIASRRNRPLARPHHAFAQAHPSSLERARTRSTRYRPAFRRRKNAVLTASLRPCPCSCTAIQRTRPLPSQLPQRTSVGRADWSASQPTSSDSKSLWSPTFKPMRTPFAALLASSVTKTATILSRLNLSTRAALLGY